MALTYIFLSRADVVGEEDIMKDEIGAASVAPPSVTHYKSYLLSLFSFTSFASTSDFANVSRISSNFTRRASSLPCA